MNIQMFVMNQGIHYFHVSEKLPFLEGRASDSVKQI